MKRSLPFFVAFLLASSGPAFAQGTPPDAGTGTGASPAQAQPGGVPAPAVSDDWLEYKDTYTGEQNDIANPHRTNDEIIALAQSRVTDALTFTPAALSDHLGLLKKGFSQQGWYEYASYLKQSGFIDMVQAQQHDATTIMSGEPSILNTGTVGGAYRWLVDAPVIATFSYPDPSGHPTPVKGLKLRVTVQFGRVSGDGAGPDGIVIESWKVAEGQ